MCEWGLTLAVCFIRLYDGWLVLSVGAEERKTFLIIKL
jgi:hypothetical protein